MVYYMNMKLVEQTDPILRKICTPFDFNEPVMDPYELAEGLHEIRRKDGGIGLAAPQVGIDTMALVIGMGNLQSEGAEDYDQVFFNPVITSTEGKETYMIEGCLSYPGLFVKVKRPETIELYWETEEGTGCDEKFDGITARILQHEIDHLNGITFLKRANRFHLEQARKQMKLSARRKKKIDEEI